MEPDTVDHEGRSTTYHTTDPTGTGAPILFVHGSGGMHTIWKFQSALADERPLVTLDLSGHGSSEDVHADPGWETLSAYASDVIAVARETGASVIVGNSLGGAVSLHISLYRSFELDGLILVGSGAKLAVVDDLLEWLETDFDRAVDFLHQSDRFFHDPNRDAVEISRRTMVETGQSVTLRDFLTCHSFDVRSDLKNVDIPCLAVVGEHDHLTPIRYHQHLSTHIPDASLIVVDDAAHLVMLERPDRFNKIISDFFDRIE